MHNAHNVGIALLGLSLLIVGNSWLSILGLLLTAWGVGKTINYLSYVHHTKEDPKRIMGGKV